jgi:hypothetical protein
MFTRQHYEKLAKYIVENEVYADGYPNDGPYGIDSLCRFFKQDNPRFNAKTFRLACGVKEEK